MPHPSFGSRSLESSSKICGFGTLRGPRAVTLPDLTGWRFTPATPEIDPAFDDGRWALADKTTTNNPTKPAAPPVLYADEYGFHHGDARAVLLLQVVAGRQRPGGASIRAPGLRKG